MENPSQRQSVTQLLKRSAQQECNRVAAIDDSSGSSITWSEMLERVQRLAGGLKNALSLSAGARVAILSNNSNRYIESYFGLPWAGLLVVPLNTRLAPPEIVEILNDAEVEAVFADADFMKILGPIESQLPPTFKRFVFLGETSETPAGSVSYESLIAENDPIDDLSAGGDDVYGLFYTGGTTGKPKGVMLTHGSIIMNAMGNVVTASYDNSSRYLHCAPMFHLADASMIFAVSMVGGTHVSIPKFTPPDTLRALQAHKVNKVVLVPVMIQFCLGMPNASSFDLTALQTIIYGGSPMAGSILQLAMKHFPNASFVQGYGMTECGPAISTLAAAYHVIGNEKLGSAGKPVYFAQVKIVDENDNEVPRGKVGEVIVRGPHVMKGYWKMPEASEKALRGGWMHTGDGGYMDEDGFIYIKDRIKDMIITGGENVYSAEVEAAVVSFPGVALCAVIGTPDEKYGELVTAVLQLKPDVDKSGVTLEALKAHCKAKIAGYKCPRKLVIKDKLPVSGPGKILKHEIRKEFWSGHEQEGLYGSGNTKTTYT